MEVISIVSFSPLVFRLMTFEDLTEMRVGQLQLRDLLWSQEKHPFSFQFCNKPCCSEICGYLLHMCNFVCTRYWNCRFKQQQQTCCCLIWCCVTCWVTLALCFFWTIKNTHPSSGTLWDTINLPITLSSMQTWFAYLLYRLDFSCIYSLAKKHASQCWI